MTITLLSVNAGRRALLPDAPKAQPTGILKQPREGLVMVDFGGVEGDQRSVEYQDAPGQALCLYSAEDYSWWEQELGRDMPYALFGENLTLSHFGDQEPRVGDVWQIGELTFELSAPRTPCATLAQRMGDPTFVRRFAQANRGGAYARVLRPGRVRAGQQATVLQRTDHPTLSEIFALNYQRNKDETLMRQALASPLAAEARRDISKWLRKAEVRTV